MSERYKRILQEIKDAMFIIGPLFTFILFSIGWVFARTETYKTYKSTVDFTISAKDSIIPLFLETIEQYERRLSDLEGVVDSVRPKERVEFMIGVRYNSEQSKYFYRDNTKINREIFYDPENNLHYYRDRNDIKRYINL